MRLSVIVPVFNEQKTIVTILKRVREQVISGVTLEIIVVNDGSSDGTKDALGRCPDLYDQLINLARNGGKGAAVIAGLHAATGDYILFQDADLEYSPEEYATLLRPVLNFNADAVIGSRFLAPSYVRVFRFSHLLGNRLLTFVFNLMNNTTFSDIYTCYLLYKRSLVDPSELKTKGWEQHAEILSLVTQRGRSLYEVPISYNGRAVDEGKKIRFYHAFRVLTTIVKMRIKKYMGGLVPYPVKMDSKN